MFVLVFFFKIVVHFAYFTKTVKYVQVPVFRSVPFITQRKKKRSEQSVLVAKKTAILVDVYLAGENFVMLYSWRYFRRTSVRSQGAVEGGCGVVQ